MANKLAFVFKPKMLVLIAVSALLMFVLVTFSKQWGGAVGLNHLEKYGPIVKKIKNEPRLANDQCPKIIQKLQEGIPNFEKEGKSNEVLKSYKLIFDCQKASGLFADAEKSLTKLIQAEPQAAKLHGWHAEILENEKRFIEAARAAHLAAQIEPENYKWHALEAKNLARNGELYRALLAYKEAINKAPFEVKKSLANEAEQVRLKYVESKEHDLSYSEEE